MNFSNEEDKISKQKNNSYKYEYEQEHFKEDGEIDSMLCFVYYKKLRIETICDLSTKFGLCINLY